MIVLHICMLQKQFLKKIKCCTPEKRGCYITLLPPYSGHLSIKKKEATSVSPAGGCCGEVQLYFSWYLVSRTHDINCQVQISR